MLSYYEYKENDPHISNDNLIVQHVTVEDFEVSKCSIKNVLSEILIKQDICNRKLTLYDWTYNDMTFTYKEGDVYYFLKIDKEGNLIFDKKKEILEINEYSQMIDKFIENEKVEGIVFYDGELSTIKKTPLITFPEMYKLHENLKSGNRSIRNKKYSEEIFSGILDIRKFKFEGKEYYFSGIASSGIQKSMARAINVREIEGNLDILPLMSVDFVRNGQTTVIPFPFKYLKEYILSDIYKNANKNTL